MELDPFGGSGLIRPATSWHPNPREHNSGQNPTQLQENPQLYNAKEPMTLFELQAWLGHRSPLSTQYYTKILPTTLTKAYADAGYFAGNVRTIEVLIDRESV